jgi:hypothetical protein
MGAHEIAGALFRQNTHQVHHQPGTRHRRRYRGLIAQTRAHRHHLADAALGDLAAGIGRPAAGDAHHPILPGQSLDHVAAEEAVPTEDGGDLAPVQILHPGLLRLTIFSWVQKPALHPLDGINSSP